MKPHERAILFLACGFLIWNLVTSLYPFRLLEVLFYGFFGLGLSWRLIADYYDLNVFLQRHNLRSFHIITDLDVKENEDRVSFDFDTDHLDLVASEATYKGEFFGRWWSFSYPQHRIIVAYDKFKGTWYYLH